ncbi:hypothetical protein ROJ8625_02404 [Roseivivax jejudonensis]|uniref:ABC transmembrane type-1 domain-containing protein n=1 Tax=Roseivivax jejudonensis TaxID=1529041 RepID=A0A1X6ZEU6_9RHOB|nr:hypothetical protein [Roseivivax jejudonensis]SLN48971.1 hypothetical protein ROJ8625_02404 [Roseivivax jejudonensis]
MRRAALALILAAGALAALLLHNPAVAGAERAASRVAVAAGAVYVSLRAINATLSVAQEVELGGSAVVSANAQPIKVLEPVDDTVERVAATVFAVSVVAATLSVAAEPLSVLGAGLLLAALVPWLLARRGRLGRVLDRAVVAGVALAFVLPALFWTGAGIADRLTEPRMAAARADLSEIADRARGISAAEAAIDGGTTSPDSFFDRTIEGVGDILGTVRTYRDSVAFFLGEADTILNASLTVIGLLLLEALILPIAVVSLALWVLQRRKP